jgi:hypothetical protein
MILKRFFKNISIVSLITVSEERDFALEKISCVAGTIHAN